MQQDVCRAHGLFFLIGSSCWCLVGAQQGTLVPAQEGQHLKVTLKQGRAWGKSFSACTSQSRSSCGALQGQGCLEDTLQIPVLSLKLCSKS